MGERDLLSIIKYLTKSHGLVKEGKLIIKNLKISTQKAESTTKKLMIMRIERKGMKIINWEIKIITISRTGIGIITTLKRIKILKLMKRKRN